MIMKLVILTLYFLLCVEEMMAKIEKSNKKDKITFHSLAEYDSYLKKECKKDNVDACISYLNFKGFTLRQMNLFDLHPKLKVELPYKFLLIPFNYWGLFPSTPFHEKWKKFIKNSEGERPDYGGIFSPSEKYNGKSPKKLIFLEMSSFPSDEKTFSLMKNNNTKAMAVDYISSRSLNSSITNTTVSLLQVENIEKDILFYNTKVKVNYSYFTTVHKSMKFKVVEYYTYAYTSGSNKLMLIRLIGDKDDINFMEKRTSEIINSIRNI